MSEIKINLSIVLPGRIMLSKEECLKTTQKVIENKSKSGKVYKKTINIQVEDWDKMDKHSVRVADKKKSSEVITFHTRKYRPALQSLNINKEAYEDMLRCPPSNIKPIKWAKMTKEQRLEANLQRITEQLGGISYTYKVFED
jgi:hypothetical protein